jgi:hypothetical protein
MAYVYTLPNIAGAKPGRANTTPEITLIFKTLFLLFKDIIIIFKGIKVIKIVY